MKLVETEGSYTVQQNYTNLDIHVGQSYSFLVTMDQNASSDYYIVASARFVNETIWKRVTGVAILHYSNSKGKASGPLPDPPQDFYDKTFSMNQARSVRSVDECMIVWYHYIMGRYLICAKKKERVSDFNELFLSALCLSDISIYLPQNFFEFIIER